MIAFYIVLPLFFFCYGGSCCAYGVHKLYRAFKRRRARARREEYESDKLPFIDAGAQRSRPVTSRDIDVGDDMPRKRALDQVRTETPVQPFNDGDRNTPKPYVPQMAGNPPPYSSQKSALSLLPPDSGMEIDFTKLSIQDIIQIKMIMGQSRSQKPKKIVSS